MSVAGVDVGFSGGIAIINGGRVTLYRMPVVKTDIGNELDYQSLRNILAKADNIFVEKQNPMPKNGVKQSFNFGGQFFAIRCIVRLLRRRVTYVRSQTWKKIMLHDMDKSKKSSSIERVKQLYPDISLIPVGCKIEHDGIADALLIAEYGRLHGDFL